MWWWTSLHQIGTPLTPFKPTYLSPTAELNTAIQAARSEGVAITRVDFLPSFRTAAAAGGRQANGGAEEESAADAAAAGEGGGEEEQEEPQPATAAASSATAAKANGDGGARVAALVAGNRVVAGPRRGRKKGKGDLIVGAGTVLASVGLADGRAFSVAWCVCWYLCVMGWVGSDADASIDGLWMCATNVCPSPLSPTNLK